MAVVHLTLIFPMIFRSPREQHSSGTRVTRATRAIRVMTLEVVGAETVTWVEYVIACLPKRTHSPILYTSIHGTPQHTYLLYYQDISYTCIHIDISLFISRVLRALGPVLGLEATGREVQLCQSGTEAGGERSPCIWIRIYTYRHPT